MSNCIVIVRWCGRLYGVIDKREKVLDSWHDYMPIERAHAVIESVKDDFACRLMEEQITFEIVYEGAVRDAG